MKFMYKDSEYDVPTSLSQIKLRQKIEFDNLYGERIEALKNEVFGDENKEVSDLDSMLLTFSVAAMNFSFFTGITLIRNSIPSVSIFPIFLMLVLLNSPAGTCTLACRSEVFFLNQSIEPVILLFQNP